MCQHKLLTNRLSFVGRGSASLHAPYALFAATAVCCVHKHRHSGCACPGSQCSRASARVPAQDHTSEVIGDIMDTVRRHQVALKGVVSTVVVTTLVLEGACDIMHAAATIFRAVAGSHMHFGLFHCAGSPHRVLMSISLIMSDRVVKKQCRVGLQLPTSSTPRGRARGLSRRLVHEAQPGHPHHGDAEGDAADGLARAYVAHGRQAGGRRCRGLGQPLGFRACTLQGAGKRVLMQALVVGETGARAVLC